MSAAKFTFRTEGVPTPAHGTMRIKARFTGSVLFTHEQDGNTLKLTVEAAVADGAKTFAATPPWSSEEASVRPILDLSFDGWVASQVVITILPCPGPSACRTP